MATHADESTGKYNLDLVVARPALERQPVGTKQILFLDFDGAKVNFTVFGGRGSQNVLPLADSLPDWGLTGADLNPVIDGVLASVTDKLYTFVSDNGLNGDFDHSGIPGEFGIDIRNSRDHADPGDNPLVSRIYIGAIDGPASDQIPGGIAQFIDPGNFKLNDIGVVNLNFLPPGLAAIPIDPSATVVDFAVAAIGTITAHEVGHLVGCFHSDMPPTDMFGGTPTLMDPAAIILNGPDFVFGSADDIDLQFGVDDYFQEETFVGLNDTLNTVSFGLSTGKGTGAQSGGTMFVAGEVATSTSAGVASAGPVASGMGGIAEPEQMRAARAGLFDALAWPSPAGLTRVENDLTNRSDKAARIWLAAPPDVAHRDLLFARIAIEDRHETRAQAGIGTPEWAGEARVDLFGDADLLPMTAGVFTRGNGARR